MPRTKLDLFIEGQRRGIPITPVNTVADLRNDPHLRSAGFWRDDQHPRSARCPGPGAPSGSTTTGGTGRPPRRSASTPRRARPRLTRFAHPVGAAGGD